MDHLYLHLSNSSTLAVSGLIATCVPFFNMAPSAKAPSIQRSWGRPPVTQRHLAGYSVYRSDPPGVSFSPPLNGTKLLPTMSFADSTWSAPPPGSVSHNDAVTAAGNGGVESSCSNLETGVVFAGVEEPPRGQTLKRFESMVSSPARATNAAMTTCTFTKDLEYRTPAQVYLSNTALITSNLYAG